MLPPLPRCSSWAYSSLISPSRISLPRKGCRVGLHIVRFEACSAFTRVAACTLARSPIRDPLPEGFRHFVASMPAPVASGWSGCRVGLAPTGKRRLVTAHTRLGKLSEAIPNALIEVLGVPTDDFFQIHHVLPRDRYRHTPAFLGQEYSDDMILLELTFITGRPKATRLALLKGLNEKIVAAVKISPADLVVLLYEAAGENISFGSGLAQRAHSAAPS